MKTIKINELGLAAYIKMKGEKLTGYNDGYIFESEKGESDWRIEYLSSESYRHDSELMSLKKFRRGQ